MQNLIDSCAKWGIETSIEGIDSRGSWELNCAYKPFFIYQKMQELKRPVLWVDADAAFINPPSVLEIFSADFAVRINPLPEEHPSKVMSGTVYVNHTEAGQKILQLWAGECIQQLSVENRKEEFWDQVALRNVLFPQKIPARVETLPLSYIKIFDRPMGSLESNPPVIEHYQASRRYKKWLSL